MSPLIWSGFILLVVVLVFLDLGVFHREAHRPSVGEALLWSGFWIALAIAFDGFIFALYGGRLEPLLADPATAISGGDAAVQFLTAYVLEKSLSIDNIFVIALIFAYFAIPHERQHRLLFWGILGAVVLRGVMIGLGAVLLAQFAWIIYVFGVLLLASAVKLLVAREDKVAIDENIFICLLRRFFPISESTSSGDFWVKTSAGWAATPMLLALVLIETSDVMFAVDSIPAVFAVTKDPFLVFTSNIFAILGLRSLYFVLAGCLVEFRYLKSSLVFVLAYVGVKMLLAHHFPIPNLVSLAVIGGILAVGIVASLVDARREAQLAAAEDRRRPEEA
ncbi:TerC family protein [Blastopirellula sp. JC732]|uniref:TerC family protein n=1 Tax=Blastopirellula sediminis TaxID=2894196 RepID=A0A9X1SI58_9BACT|nr:TerC family protein [Blastopirellula sediminis]MCC9605758.1 TerC family protein [Blastopirellula sediminis]MCC9630942.1 TerC family protein [Blastopirellula sediminis]